MVKIKVRPAKVPRAAVVDGIVEKDRKILLVQRSSSVEIGKLALPGGFVEANETVERAVVREVKEETGIDVIPTAILGVYSAPKRDPRWRKGVRTVATVFVCKPVGGKLKSQPEENSEVKFFPLNKLNLKKIAFDHGKIIKDYLRWKKQGETYWSTR